ncbi:MAG: response regulator [Nitrosopumilus sp.]|nr:response regulator [Nitrosopumilus sp.]MDH3735822.1 response regulator [Nitrosopumilus sp.]MDH3822447.1 response regulator [Nitrosopumilus sp.]MDH3833138.1 response regulator [Nitrosopumilus sp.]
MENKIILIADDDLDVLESTQYMLLDEGYEVITAHNGEEAVDMYKKHNPNIVLLDLRMPVLDGYDAFFNIKKYDPNAKVIFITAFSIDSQKTEKAKDKGLLDLMYKPIEFREIVKIIQKYS